MAAAFVIDAEARSTDSNIATTSAVDTTGANFIALVVTNDNGAEAVSDSKGNTWTPVAAAIGANPLLRMFYCFNPNVGSGHTFTNDPANPSFPSIAMQAFSGVVTSPLDQHSEASAVQPGSITPSEDGEVVITAAVNNGTGHELVNSPFDVNQTADLNGDANSYTISMAYEIQTTATARNPTWTNLGGIQTVIASFKADPGGGGGVFSPMMAILAAQGNL